MASKPAAPSRMRKPRAPATDNPRSWLVLLPQHAANQGTARVRLWRRLQQLGALALKSGAHVLPDHPQRLEDAEWIVREIRDAGGEAALLRASFLEGGEDEQLVRSFREAREAEYAIIASDARRLRAKPGKRTEAASDATGKLRRRLEQIDARDYFDAPGRAAAVKAIAALERRSRMRAPEAVAPMATRALPPAGSVWVTRADVHVDRMASAWLIQRRLDSTARFRFVRERRYAPRRGEVRFDMLDAEFTHVGDACTFEVLLRASGIADAALSRIAEIVHELDLRDGRYHAAETAGVAAALAGVVASTTDDLERIRHAAVILDGLHASLVAQKVRRR